MAKDYEIEINEIHTHKYCIFSNLIRTPLTPCSVLKARTLALSFGQTPALDRESNPHSFLIRI
jgi:hypothetical protein